VTVIYCNASKQLYSVQKWDAPESKRMSFNLLAVIELDKLNE
jgi:hypothetical protein